MPAKRRASLHLGKRVMISLFRVERSTRRLNIDNSTAKVIPTWT